MQNQTLEVLKKNNVPLGALIKNIVDTPEIRQKMRNYINLFGFEPSSDDSLLPLQVHNIQNTIRESYLKQCRKNHLTKESFDNYVNSDSFESDYLNFENEMEAKQGFDGFDGDGFDNLLPLAAAAPLLKKGIGAIGKAIKKKTDAKKAKANSLQSVDNTIKQQEAVKQLVNNGLTLEQAKEGMLQLAKKEIAEDRKGTTKVVDLLNKTVADYKQSQENKAMMEKLPTMLAVVAIVGIVGYFLGKK
jgi:hypothetical protein